MTIRRMIGSFLVFLFIIVALPTFVVFALSRTFLDLNFFSSNATEPAYQLMVNAIGYNIYTKDPLIQKYFTADDVHKIVADTVPIDLFKVTMKDFTDDLELVKTQPQHPLTINLKPYRDNLEKVAQQLAIHIFQALPACKSTELPEFNEDGIATCVPDGTNYDVVAGPLSKAFETAVLNSLPDTVDLSLAKNQNGSMFTYIFDSAEKVKFYAIGTLMVLIVLLAFVLYRPFTTIVRFEGVAFLFSGFLGFLMSVWLGAVPPWFVQSYAQKNESILKALGGDALVTKYFQQIFGIFTAEIFKISFVFLALGAILLFIYFFFLRKEAKRITED